MTAPAPGDGADGAGGADAADRRRRSRPCWASGRIVKPHGLRGDVIVSLTTNRHERVAVGSVLHADGRPAVRGGAVLGPPGSVHRDLRRGGRHRRRRGAAGHPLSAPPLEDPDALWVHDLIGSVVVDPAGAELGTVAGVEANPASDLLVLDGGGLIPLRFVTGSEPGRAGDRRHPRRPARPAVTATGGTGAGGPASGSTSSPSSPRWSTTTASASILGRARGAGRLDLRTHDIRDAAHDVHRTVDDAPFGGGAGMVLAPEPVFGASRRWPRPRRPAPAAAPAVRRRAGASTRPWPRELAGLARRVLPAVRPLRGRGPAGGRPPGATASCRSATSCWPAASWPPWWWSRPWPACCPGCSATSESADEESFAAGLLEYPQYTRPAEFRGWAVPEVLRSGDHGGWRPGGGRRSLVRTLQRRPDLIERPGRADRGGGPAAGRRTVRCACSANTATIGSLVGAGLPGVRTDGPVHGPRWGAVPRDADGGEFERPRKRRAP